MELKVKMKLVSEIYTTNGNIVASNSSNFPSDGRRKEERLWKSFRWLNSFPCYSIAFNFEEARNNLIRERERAVPEMGTRWRKDFLSAAENLFRTRILAYPDPTQTRQLIEAGTKTKKTWKVKKRNRNEKCRHLRSIIFDYRFRILIKISSDIYANVEAEPLGATGSFNNKIDSSFSLVWMETAAGYLLREEISHPADVKSEITVG